MNPEELQRKIQEESDKIATLEKSYPDEWHSREWWIHHTEVRDAYWRRRMLTTQLEGGDINQTAEVY